MCMCQTCYPVCEYCENPLPDNLDEIAAEEEK